jgi:hypothetical protein
MFRPRIYLGLHSGTHRPRAGGKVPSIGTGPYETPLALRPSFPKRYLLRTFARDITRRCAKKVDNGSGNMKFSATFSTPLMLFACDRPVPGTASSPLRTVPPGEEIHRLAELRAMMTTGAV